MGRHGEQADFTATGNPCPATNPCPENKAQNWQKAPENVQFYPVLVV